MDRSLSRNNAFDTCVLKSVFIASTLDASEPPLGINRSRVLTEHKSALLTCGYCFDHSIHPSLVALHILRDHGIRWPTVSVCTECGSFFGSHVDYSKHRLQVHSIRVDEEVYSPIFPPSNVEPIEDDSNVPRIRIEHESMRIQETSDYDRILNSLLNILQIPSTGESFIENIYQF